MIKYLCSFVIKKKKINCDLKKNTNTPMLIAAICISQDMEAT